MLNNIKREAFQALRENARYTRVLSSASGIPESIIIRTPNEDARDLVVSAIWAIGGELNDLQITDQLPASAIIHTIDRHDHSIAHKPVSRPIVISELNGHGGQSLKKLLGIMRENNVEIPGASAHMK